MSLHDKAVKLVKDFMGSYLLEYWPDEDLNETVEYLLRALEEKKGEEGQCQNGCTGEKFITSMRRRQWDTK